MKARSNRIVIIVLLTALDTLLSRQLSAQIRYSVIDLGTLGGTSSSAYGINNSGQIVGSAKTPGDAVVHGFLWQNGTMTDLQIPGGGQSAAYGINNSGQAVGYAVLQTGEPHAFLWQNGAPTDLGSLGGGLSFAYGINNLAQVVGYALTAPGSDGRSFQHAFLWQNGAMIDLGTISGVTGINNSARGISHASSLQYTTKTDRHPLGSVSSVGYGINDLTQVAGGSITNGRGNHAFLWQDTIMTDIDSLGSLSEARAINNSTQIVGSAVMTSPDGHAFLWQNGAMTDLGTLGGAASDAYGINDSGQVVGSAWKSSIAFRAFLSERGLMSDLNDLIDPNSGWILLSATDINDKGEIVGYGRLNGQDHAYLLTTAPTITSPHAGELWIAGEQDTIRWTAPGITSITISLSTDYLNGNGTFAVIATNTPADSGKYIWSIADTILSRKCKVKISDASDPGKFAESGLFRIKPYALTRVTADSNYDRFLPGKDGWQFSNSSNDMWPTMWWTQFDYENGRDPNTGCDYPDRYPFVEPPRGLVPFPIPSSPSDFPDWPLFVHTFGINQCYWLGHPFCVFKGHAEDKWTAKREDWGGSCFGLAISSILAFHYKNQFLAANTGIPPFDSLFSIRMTDSVRIVINSYFTRQFGQLDIDHRTLSANTTPRETLGRIRQMFSTEDPDDDASLAFLDPARSGGHAVVPYNLGRDSTNSGRFRLYVYDSNQPTSLTSYILIDSMANTWQEFTGFGWGPGTDKLYPNPAAIQYFGPPILPSGRPSSIQPATGIPYENSKIELDASSAGHTVIISTSGDSIGYANGHAFNSITGALPLIPLTGHPSPPWGYTVPLGTYKISMSAFSDSLVYFSSQTDSLTFTYARAGADSNQTDDLRFDGGLLLKNRDTVTKPFFLKAIFGNDTSEQDFSINGLSLDQNDSIKSEGAGQSTLRLTNEGKNNAYDLSLRWGSASGEHRFEHRQISLPSTSSHQIAPGWPLLDQPVPIYVDQGNDGTIDDTLFVTNEVTSASETYSRGIPKEFRLEQNYPNPFNPSTVVRYQLPVRSYVTLKVYDVLGREAAILVDEMQETGYKSVEWDASRFPSGVYFCRLHAETFSAIKKLLLIR